MSCSVEGGCRICPGMWLAALMLAFVLAQSAYERWSGSRSSAKNSVQDTSTENESASAERGGTP